MNKLRITSIMLVLFTSVFFAQNTNVKGKIIDKETKENIFGVTIIVKGTQRGTTTNELGEFVLEKVNLKDKISISYMGYESITISPNSNYTIISLKKIANELSEVIISASRRKQVRKDVPVAISSISTKTMDEVKPSSVDQVLNQSAGVLMVDLGNEQHMMAIRQPISTKSLFLYLEDGIPIRPTGVFNHNALLEMNMAATKGIEIIRGPFSSLYGSEAIGGAVNFFTANPTQNLTGSFSGRGNNHGYLRMDAKISGTINKTGFYISGYKSQIKDGIREYGDYDKEAITLKITHQFNKNTSWNNTLSYINYLSEMSGSLDEKKFKAKDYTSYHTFTYRKANALRFNSTFKHNWNENNHTSLSLIYRDNTMKQNPSYRIDSGADFDSYTPGQENDNSFNSYGLVAQHNIDLERAKLSFGTSIDFSPNTYNVLETNVYRNKIGMFESSTLTGKTLADYEVDIFNLGGYFSGEYDITDNFKLSGGFRLDRFNYNFTNLIGAGAKDYKAPNTKNTFTAFTPRLGAIYMFSKNIGLYTNYSKGFLPPSVGQLYRKKDVPLLAPSKFNNYELGTWMSLWQNKVYLDLAAYYLEGRDEVVSVSIKEGKVRRSENRSVGKTEHYGLEYALKFKPIAEVSLRFSGSYSKHKYLNFVTKIVNGQAAVDYSGKEMKGAPSWVNNSEIAYQPNFLKGLRLSLEWQHVDKYFTDNANKFTYDGYDVFNSRIGYKKGHWHFWVNVLNISNKLYANRASTGWGRTTYTPGTPRTFNLGFEINLF